jgi:hypothetical protein
MDKFSSSSIGQHAVLSSWLGKPIGWKANNELHGGMTAEDAVHVVPVDYQQTILLSYAYETLVNIDTTLKNTLFSNLEREELTKLNLTEKFETFEKADKDRTKERTEMFLQDPREQGLGKDLNKNVQVGSHLAPMSQLEALRRVEYEYPSNNQPVSGIQYPSGMNDQSFAQLAAARISTSPVSVESKPQIFNNNSVEEVASSLTKLQVNIRENISSLKTVLVRKDANFLKIKDALTTQLVEKRKREEGKIC